MIRMLGAWPGGSSPIVTAVDVPAIDHSGNTTVLPLSSHGQGRVQIGMAQSCNITRALLQSWHEHPRDPPAWQETQ